jgi:hypothetical protein
MESHLNRPSQRTAKVEHPAFVADYSHSIVPGGLEVTS